MIRERTIKYALDKITGEVFDADKIFKNKPDGFEVRKENALDQYDLICLECKQKLTVSSSKYDRLHFKHLPNHDFCCLSEMDLTPDDIDKFNKILVAKESERHKELKNRIAKRLSNIIGIDIASIAVDNKFIIKGRDKRKPDVYCKYFDKELVFEIQLSDLSLRYILSRTEFYKKHGIFLIWILDNFDHERHSFKRDIKYLTEYENFFKLDEQVDNFQFVCEYKYVFITKDNKLLCKWKSKSVPLEDIKFDNEIFQIYYYNYGSKWTELECEQRKESEDLAERSRKIAKKRKYEQALKIVNQIIEDINVIKERGFTFKKVEEKITKLDAYELSVLNERLDLKNRERESKPILNYWINAKADYAFLSFLLNCVHIELDVNKKDPNGISTFQELLNESTGLMADLFKRGYQLTDADRNAINMKYPNDFKRELTIYELANNLTNREYTDSIFRQPNIFLTIQSIKLKQIIGFRYPTNAWIAFANNAAEHYREYWEYIELAFKHYGMWDNLICLDKKGTFQIKLQKLYQLNFIQHYDCEDALKNLFPEIF